MKPTSVLALVVAILGVSLAAGCGSSDPGDGWPQVEQDPVLVGDPAPASPDWAPMPPLPGEALPSPRSYGAMALVADQQVLMFGGYASDWWLWGHQQNDTWVYDLAENLWTEKHPSTSEELKGRYRHSLAPLGSHKVLLFGGYRYHRVTPVPDALNETWVYDLDANRWTRKRPGTLPEERYWAGLAAIGENRALLFGGSKHGGSHEMDDTWVYDVVSNTWTRKGPASHPSAREGHVMAFIGDDKVVLFSGYDEPNDTWVYDLGDDTWTNMSPVGVPALPPSRYDAGMAYLGGCRVALFAGIAQSGDDLDDTWVYDLKTNTWTEMDTATAPPARCKAGMAGVNPGETVVFGGTSYQTEYMGDTWVFTDPFITWNTRYLPDQQTSVSDIQQTTDGGYVMVGRDTGFGPQTDTRHPQYAAWLNKVDAYGNMVWDQAFADDNMSNMCRSIQQTSDGGYILVGDTYHYACNGSSCSATDPDVLIIKTDASGNKQWGQVLGGEGTHQGYAVRQTADGGYIVTGTSQGTDNIRRLYLLKTDANGDPEWAHAYITPGGLSSQGNDVMQTPDGGYVATGSLADPTWDDMEGWLVKTDPDGTEEWNKILVPEQPDTAKALCLSPDGGYVVAGAAWCPHSDNTDGWVVKINAAGTEEEWQWTGEAGGFLNDTLMSVKPTFDGNYVAAGCTYLPGDTTPDAWIIKFRPDGTEAWDTPRTFGAGVGAVQAYSVDPTSDGGYILGATGGYTVTPDNPERAWAIKTDSSGNAPNEPEP